MNICTRPRKTKVQKTLHGYSAKQLKAVIARKAEARECQVSRITLRGRCCNYEYRITGETGNYLFLESGSIRICLIKAR